MPIELSSDQGSAAVEHVKSYIHSEFEIDIGSLAAELLIRDFLSTIGPSIYNTGIRDARAWFTKRLEDADIDFASILADERLPSESL